MDRAEGVTRTERFLGKLARNSFLTLWSYPNPYRDQGRVQGRGHGKELCDLLVVCGNEVVIFSDKECAFPETGILHLDWTRWYRKAIQASAKQIYGAENTIRRSPERIFLDAACTVRPPAPLPGGPSLRVHRVIVAHGVSATYARQMGHTRDSLRLISRLKGADHYLAPEEGGIPVAVGQVDPDRGFIHVLDQGSVGPLMDELDTISDFLDYLKWKEQAFTNGGLESAESELDLVAFYLENRNVEGYCALPRPGYAMRFGPAWEAFRASDGYKAKRDADRASYFVDELVQSLTRSVAEGKVLPDYPGEVDLANLGDLERVLRSLARESRLRRRVLGAMMWERIRTTPHNKRAPRFIRPHRQGEPAYMLCVYPRHRGRTEEEYRDERFLMLIDYCLVAKLKFLISEDVIGIATEPGATSSRSFDAMFLAHAYWTPQLQEFARQREKVAPFFKYAGEFTGYTEEYPVGRPAFVGARIRPPQSSTGKCPCGSGKRYSNCHGTW